MPASAQWWSGAPHDYEDCAASAQTSAVAADARADAIADCEAKFAGRRKPGGGYTYYDFMQNRHFDIAGPNPTAAEQKYIDEQYTLYLSERRRSLIEAAFFRKQHEMEQAAIFREDKAVPKRKAAGNVRPASRPKAAAPHVIATLSRPRPKTAAHCRSDDFFASCHWPRISSGVHDLRKALFGSLWKDARS